MRLVTIAGRMLGTGLAAALLAGCGDAPGLEAFDHRLAHPLSAEARVAVLVVELPDRAGALSNADAARLQQFAGDYVRRGDGAVEVVVSSPVEADAAAHAAHLVATLAGAGIPAGSIAARAVSGAAADGSAVMRYRQWVAVVPECGLWSDTAEDRYNNANTNTLGCATQRNIGMMVANPRDLLRPADSEPRMGVVGERVITRYGRGETTATQVIHYGSDSGR